MEGKGYENEFKFLIREAGKWFHSPDFFKPFGGIESFFHRHNYKMSEIKQGYIRELPYPKEVAAIVKLSGFIPSEIRIRQKGSLFLITLKSEAAYSRQEFETSISEGTFHSLWPLTEGSRIHKKRLKVENKGFFFEFDLFDDPDLILAEVETDGIINTLPDELIPGLNVTGNTKYYNQFLAR
jgi:adenylate cyclase